MANHSSRLVLAGVVFFILLGFGFTQWLVNLHHQTELSLARTWSGRGAKAMQLGYPDIAAVDYRTALVYDRENDEYRLRLSEALLAANRLPEAHAHLYSLWEQSPGDGAINLDMARLWVRRGNPSEAVRYYHNAIDGVWTGSSPREQRVGARFELVHYLLQQNNIGQAEAELIALQADPPEEPQQQIELGDLLHQVHLETRALRIYNTVLKQNPRNVQAWFGKGNASFALADYRDAERSYQEAVNLDPALAAAKSQLELTRTVMRIDPTLRGLSHAERARRVAQSFNYSLQRLQSCASQQGITLSATPAPVTPAAAPQAPPPAPTTSTTPAASSLPATLLKRLYDKTLHRQTAGTDTPETSSANGGAAPSANPAEGLESVYARALQQKPQATESRLRRNPDALDPTMDLVFRMERATQGICKEMGLNDRALLTIAEHQGESQE